MFHTFYNRIFQSVFLFYKYDFEKNTLDTDAYSVYILQEREEILNVHMGRWTQPPSSQLLSHLAENTIGYCGSDLKALCSEAVIQGFRRAYPQVYNSECRLLLEPNQVKVRNQKSKLFTAKDYYLNDFR